MYPDRNPRPVNQQAYPPRPAQTSDDCRTCYMGSSVLWMDEQRKPVRQPPLRAGLRAETCPRCGDR